MPRPTPQHGLNIQPPFPFFSLHALTLCVHSPPQASLCHISCMCAFACINVLYVHPTVLLFCFFPLQFVWDQQKDINHSRDYYNLHFNLLAANVKAGRGVARFRASASGKEEAETVDLGRHCLEICYQHRTRPCQHQLTLGYRDTETTAGRVCLNSGSKHGTGQSAALTAALPLVVKSTHWAGLLFALELNITYFKHKVCQTLWWLCHVVKICNYWWHYYGWWGIIMSRVSICASNASELKP